MLALLSTLRQGRIIMRTNSGKTQTSRPPEGEGAMKGGMNTAAAVNAHGCAASRKTVTGLRMRKKSPVQFPLDEAAEDKIWGEMADEAKKEGFLSAEESERLSARLRNA